MLNAALDVMPLVLVLIGIFTVLVVSNWSRSAAGDDADWRIARLERKVDLISTQLGIEHDDQAPETVVSLARAGRKIEAIKEYRRLTGANLTVAKREVELVIDRLSSEKKTPQGDF